MTKGTSYQPYHTGCQLLTVKSTFCMYWINQPPRWIVTIYIPPSPRHSPSFPLSSNSHTHHPPGFLLSSTRNPSQTPHLPSQPYHPHTILWYILNPTPLPFLPLPSISMHLQQPPSCNYSTNLTNPPAPVGRHQSHTPPTTPTPATPLASHRLCW